MSGDDVRPDESRREEVGRTEPKEQAPPGVEQADDVKNAERLPRKGDELDELADKPTD